MPNFVLDSFAVLIWILDQDGADDVHRLLEQAAAGAVSLTMSMINAGEVLYMLAKKQGASAASEFEHDMWLLPVRYVTPEADDILAAARIKSKAAISYADAFAVSLAIAMKARLVTGDPEMWKMRDLVDLKWVGPELRAITPPPEGDRPPPARRRGPR